ncbi:MAG: O-antigen ligase family protein [Nitrospirae bacterium]|nr:O-antigen ligase family protein [Nitrospirota bacterium]
MTIKLLRHEIQTVSAPNRTLNILIIASIIWGFIALLNAIDPVYSVNEITFKMSSQYLLYFLSFSFAGIFSHDIENIKKMLLPVALATIIMSVYACFQFFQSPVFLQNRVTGFTGAFYRLAVFLVLAVPLIITLAYTMLPRLKWMLLMILPFAGAALVLTSVRAAWIAVVIEAAILILMLFKKYRKTIVLGITALSLIFIVLAYHSEYKNLIVHGSEEPRLKALNLSREIVRSYPLTGIGYGKKTFSKYYPEVNEVRHAHNIFINTIIEVGFIGLIIFIAMLVSVAKDFFIAIRKETVFDRKLILSGIFASLAGFLTLNLFDYMYHGWPGQMFWMLIGIGYGLRTPDSALPRKDKL